MKNLDDSERGADISARIQRKDALKKLYDECYDKYLKIREQSPESGISLEIGSGSGFLKEVAPEVITADIVPYQNLDMVLDAAKLPYQDSSISSLFLLNTLHHLPDVKSFFDEVVRCLVPGGRLLIIDQYHGWLSSLIYRYIHHEPYSPDATEWSFETSGPVSGANGALCWILFFRDRSLFEKTFPELDIVSMNPNTPLRYWLAGGLKWWTLIPKGLFATATKIDYWLSRKCPSMCSFIDIEIIRKQDR